MKQANYNGRLRGSVGGVGRGVGRGVDSLAPPPGCDLFGYLPPHVASLRAAQYGVTHGCDPSGVPCSLSEQLGCRLRALRCRFSLAADGNQRGELAMPICPVGAVRCSVAFP